MIFYGDWHSTKRKKWTMWKKGFLTLSMANRRWKFIYTSLIQRSNRSMRCSHKKTSSPPELRKNAEMLLLIDLFGHTHIAFPSCSIFNITWRKYSITWHCFVLDIWHRDTEIDQYEWYQELRALFVPKDIQLKTQNRAHESEHSDLGS